MYPSFNARALGLDLPAEESIDLAAAAGFVGIDLMVRDLVDRGRNPREVRRRLDDQGLRSGAWPLPIRWRDSTEPEFHAALSQLPRYAEAAALLGLTRTGTWVEPEVQIPPGVSPAVALDATWDRHVRRLGAMNRVLSHSGIRLGLEVVGVESFRTGPGPIFIASTGSPRLGELIRRLDEDGPPIGLLVDTWHLHAAGETIEVPLGWGVERVVWVHVADLPAGCNADRHAMIDELRGLPGEHGAVDSGHALRRLAELGYSGPVTAEPLAGCTTLVGRTPEEIARRAAQALHAIWPEPKRIVNPTRPTPQAS